MSNGDPPVGNPAGYFVRMSGETEEGAVKCHRQTGNAIITLLAALAMPLGLAAQDKAAPAPRKHSTITISSLK